MLPERSRQLLPVVCVALVGAFCAPALAFDVEGFKPGMTRAAISANAEKQGYQVRALDDATLLASRPNVDGYLTFNICKERLVSVQQGNFPGNLKTLTSLAADFTRKHGPGYSVVGDTRMTQAGFVHEFGAWWNAGTHFIRITFMTRDDIAGPDSLSLSFQTKNDCFKVPR
jgi:hypothetical protein